MRDFVFYNHEFFPTADARLRAASVAALYGKGIFTTIAICNQKPFLWEKHWRRLNINAGQIKIDLSAFSEEFVKNALAEIIKKTEVKNARARITFFDESPGKIWTYAAPRRTSLLIQIGDLKLPRENLTLTVSPFSINSTSPLAGVKSCNYLENILAMEEAKARNFDEAIRVNERGEIAAACLANIFWLKDDKLFTPSRKTGCLAGTTREFVMENYKVSEVEETTEILNESEAIFLTSAGIGVAQISKYEEKSLAQNSGEITKIIRRLTDQFKT